MTKIEKGVKKKELMYLTHTKTNIYNICETLKQLSVDGYNERYFKEGFLNYLIFIDFFEVNNSPPKSKKTWTGLPFREYRFKNVFSFVRASFKESVSIAMDAVDCDKVVHAEVYTDCGDFLFCAKYESDEEHECF